MFKLFTIGFLATAFAAGMADSVQAGGGCQCRMAPRCSVPSCSAPAAQPAPAMDQMNHAATAPSASNQTNSGTYRSFSYEPSVPAVGNTMSNAIPFYRSQPTYRVPHSKTPSYLIPKADPRRYAR
jgi:hypothetical protein